MSKENFSLQEVEPAYCDRLEKLLLPNPFYSNHVFSKKDLARNLLEITRTERFILFFRPTLVQLSEDREFHYKTWQGRYYLLDVKELTP